MVVVRQIFACFFLLCLMNAPLLWMVVQPPVLLGMVITLALLVFFVMYNILPDWKRAPTRKLQILFGGYYLLIMGCICFVLESGLACYVGVSGGLFVPWMTWICNSGVALLVVAVLMLHGFIRVFTTSTQLGMKRRLCLVLFWWIPVVNLVFLFMVCAVVREEYRFSCQKHALNESRKGQAVCKTKYPILMVHGIFFRDWKAFNYWGRIPEELTKNGAVLYYGNQQSSASVEDSAKELKVRILEVLKETGAEKLHIIAHSKGGLDARYAISCLGMGSYVASLTMLNTPQTGCKFTGKIIDTTPGLVSTVGKTYDKLYKKLGDKTPDFFAGVCQLTDEACKQLNQQMPDCPGVLYQSIGSKLKSAASADFPLNIGYRMIQPIEGDNDGLVAVKAMMWTNFLGVLTPTGKQGISHGDVIDLTRKNIKGFDVCEFYVKLVMGLKKKGL